MDKEQTRINQEINEQQILVNRENVLIGGGAVNSVNGMTGDVVLTAGDVGAYDKDEVDDKLSNKQDSLTEQQLAAVNSNIDATKVEQIATNTSDISAIEDKIPTQASSSNQLADKNFVNSSIATNTAYYISDDGEPFQSVEDLEAYSGGLSNNDYAFVVGTDTAGNTTYTRYKYNSDTQEWAEEYVLNNSSFTSAQWDAINSGITSGNVEKLSDLANIKTIGANLNLDSAGELSATDTTYSNFTGTDGTAAGTAGLVPAPVTTDAGKYLKADGTWGSVSGGLDPSTTFWGQAVNNGVVDGTITMSSGTAKCSWGITGTSGSRADFYIGNGNNYNNATTKVNIESNQLTLTTANNNIIRCYSNYIDAISHLIRNVTDPVLAQDAATKNYVDAAAVGSTETYTIANTNWATLSGASPYTYSADVTANYTIGANTIAKLMNDQAVSFATYGFAIGAISNQTVTIYSIGAPSASVTLKINYKG